jgi:hypothetical protein
MGSMSENTASGTFSNVLSRCKDLVAVLRDGFVLMLAVYAVFNFDTVKTALADSGISEFEGFGVKIKTLNAQITINDKKLIDANANIADLQEELSAARSTIDLLKTNVSDQATTQKLESLDASIVRTTERSESLQQSMASVISKNTKFVKASTAEKPYDLAVVFGGDRTLEAAQHEIGRARKAGLPNPEVYFREGSFRSIVTTSDRAKAEQYLVLARLQKSDAYIVNLATWCPERSTEKSFTSCVQR